MGYYEGACTIVVTIKTKHKMYRITNGAEADLMELFGPLYYEDIQERVAKAAPVTHKLGNRRHLDLVVLLKGNTIMQAGLFDACLLGRDTHQVCKACFGTGRVKVPDICGYCEGEGCSRCKGVAEHTTIKCPEPTCKTNQKGRSTHGNESKKQKRHERY